MTSVALPKKRSSVGHNQPQTSVRTFFQSTSKQKKSDKSMTTFAKAYTDPNRSFQRHNKLAATFTCRPKVQRLRRQFFTKIVYRRRDRGEYKIRRRHNHLRTYSQQSSEFNIIICILNPSADVFGDHEMHNKRPASFGKKKVGKRRSSAIRNRRAHAAGFIRIPIRRTYTIWDDSGWALFSTRHHDWNTNSLSINFVYRNIYLN